MYMWMGALRKGHGERSLIVSVGSQSPVLTSGGRKNPASSSSAYAARDAGVSSGRAPGDAFGDVAARAVLGLRYETRDELRVAPRL